MDRYQILLCGLVSTVVENNSSCVIRIFFRCSTYLTYIAPFTDIYYLDAVSLSLA